MWQKHEGLQFFPQTMFCNLLRSNHRFFPLYLGYKTATLGTILKRTLVNNWVHSGNKVGRIRMMVVKINHWLMSLEEAFDKNLQVTVAGKISKTEIVFGVGREAAALVGGVMMMGKGIVTVAESGAGTSLGGGVEIVTIATEVKMEGEMARDIVIGRREVGNLTSTEIEGTMTIGIMMIGNTRSWQQDTEIVMTGNTEIVTTGNTEIATTGTGDEIELMTEITIEDENIETSIGMM